MCSFFSVFVCFYLLLSFYYSFIHFFSFICIIAYAFLIFGYREFLFIYTKSSLYWCFFYGSFSLSLFHLTILPVLLYFIYLSFISHIFPNLSYLSSFLILLHPLYNLTHFLSNYISLILKPPKTFLYIFFFYLLIPSSPEGTPLHRPAHSAVTNAQSPSWVLITMARSPRLGFREMVRKLWPLWKKRGELVAKLGLWFVMIVCMCEKEREK